MPSRREVLRKTAVAGVMGLTTSRLGGAGERVVKNGRLKQSVNMGYGGLDAASLCRAASEVGLYGIDFLKEADWPVARDHGLTCTMAWANNAPWYEQIPKGLNDPAHHDVIVASLLATIPKAARAGVPSVIAFFGNRNGRSDDEAIRNCVAGLERAKRTAEDQGVTIALELLNSKVDHKDYQGDRTSFGVEVVKRLGSPRVKLLYDIYHMQIMEGDVVRTIRANHEWIDHFHTAGVPGRHEPDASQELNYAAVCRAIVETGFAGSLCHEFTPTRDPLLSLREAVALCDV
jgi:hydroxypyruvate isomerase